MVTLVAWGAIVLGLIRIFAPEIQVDGRRSALYPVLAALFAIGTFLTFKGHGGNKG